MTGWRTPEPLGWAHWRAERRGLPESRALEVACYTDTRPTGDLADLAAGLGPLQIYNTTPGMMKTGRPRMALVIRVGLHETPQITAVPWAKTKVALYTGVDLGAEFGALLSLALGIRCRSGGLIRTFEGSDPRGEPTEWAHVQPYLAPPRYDGNPIIPVPAEVSVHEAVPYLARYPSASQGKAVALVRAARLYEQALWIAESDPELSWLLLVTAIEAAALQREGPIPRGRRWHVNRPTTRFVNFIRDFAPPPPLPRPQHSPLDWSMMSQHARTIYRWRSHALHDGIPFPRPMFEPPPQRDEKGVLTEIPGGFATATGSTVWRASDTPHVARDLRLCRARCSASMVEPNAASLAVGSGPRRGRDAARLLGRAYGSAGQSGQLINQLLGLVHPLVECRGSCARVRLL
jgi:hypothetical protein